MVKHERCPTGNIRNAKMLKHVISGEFGAPLCFFAWQKHHFPWLDVFFISKDCLAPKSEGMNYHPSPIQIARSLFGAKRYFWCAQKNRVRLLLVFVQEHWSWWKWKMTSLHHIFTIHLYFTQCLNARKPYVCSGRIQVDRAAVKRAEVGITWDHSHRDGDGIWWPVTKHRDVTWSDPGCQWQMKPTKNVIILLCTGTGQKTHGKTLTKSLFGDDFVHMVSFLPCSSSISFGASIMSLFFILQKGVICYPEIVDLK